MINPQILEASFKEFIEDLSSWLPDGIIQVDIDLLYSLGLLSVDKDIIAMEAVPIDYHFHIIETDEKITLVNDSFIVWVVPEVVDGVPSTYTFIAINTTEGKPELEMAFSNHGIYNSSRFVLRVLEAFLEEIQENEKQIAFFKGHV